MTDIHKYLAEAGIAAYPDNRLFQIRFLPGNRARVRRVEAIQRLVLSIEYGQEVGFLASLVFFDLVPLKFLHKAVHSLDTDNMYVEWEDAAGIFQRRMLSIFTISRFRSLANPSTEYDISNVTTWISQSGLYSALSTRLLEPEVQLDCIAWGARYLPMPLWAHVSGLQVMVCLPQAGFHTYLGLRTANPLDTTVVNDDAFEAGSLLADMLDELDSGSDRAPKPLNLKEARHLIDRVITVFVRRHSAIRKAADADLFQELLKIKSQALEMDVRVAWVICWMLDLFESGTPQKPNAAFETRTRYCRVAALKLLMGLLAMGERIESLDGEELEKLCLSLMLDPTVGDKQGLGAAVSSFLYFAHEELGAPLIRPQLHKFIPDIVPRAQFVTQDQVQLASDWIDHQQGADPRLIQMSKVIVGMGYAAPFRLNELLNLRIGNIQKLQGSGHYEIEIYKDLKTDSSKRRVAIDEAWVIRDIDEWMKMRHAEDASSKDLVFGTPDFPKKTYRRSACTRFILKLLKLVTGDSCMTFHALRHSWASRNVDLIFRSSSTINVDRLAHVAYAMGHASAQMTLRFYSHLYEPGMKQTIDVLQSSMELSAHEASCIAGHKKNTLTQRALRKGQSISEMTLSLLTTMPAQVVVVPPSVTTVIPPRILRTFNHQLTAGQVLKVIEMGMDGMDENRIASVVRLQIAQVQRIRQAAIELALQLSSAAKSLTILERSALTIAESLRYTKINIRAADNPKFAKLLSFIRLPIDPKLALVATTGWKGMHTHGHLNVQDQVLFSGLLQLLKAAGVDPAHLILRLETPGLSQAQCAMSLASPRRVFSDVFGRSPQCEPLEYAHPARPTITMVWSSSVKDGSPNFSAKAGITGLHALMFALSVLVVTNEENSYAAP